MSETGEIARTQGHATLFLDVDGVLNSYPVTGLRFLRERRKKARAWAFELHFRPRIVRALDRLVETHDVDIVWLSTWSHRCTEELEPALGFRHTFDVVPMPDDSFNRFAGDPQVWWKALHMREWLDEDTDRRAIWIDDDLAAPVTHEHFADAYPDRLLMVAPRFSDGLTTPQLRDIRAFLDRRTRRQRRAARRTHLLTPTASAEASTSAKSSTDAPASPVEASASAKPSASARPSTDGTTPSGRPTSDDESTSSPGTTAQDTP